MPSKKFLDGHKGIVMTDTSKMALTVCFHWDGKVDILCHTDPPEAVRMLRELADALESQL